MALRPSLLDDLGLLPAIRALITDFEGRTGIATTFKGVDALPDLSEDAELALFRGVQEGLSNVARHADADSVSIAVTLDGGGIAVTLEDDGQGLKTTDGIVALEERTGLAGMRERLAAQGGRVALEPTSSGGLRLQLWLPANNGDHR